MIWAAALAEEADTDPLNDALKAARDAEAAVLVSPISAWEVGLLAARGRLQLAMPPKAWLERAMGAGGLRWSEMSVDVLMASSTLPGEAHGDPADRIIIATAREYGFRVVTRDRKILDYADKGHVLAMEC